MSNVGFAEHRPSKHKTFVSHLYNVGPTSAKLIHYCINGIQMFCVCWDCLSVAWRSRIAEYDEAFMTSRRLENPLRAGPGQETVDQRWTNVVCILGEGTFVDRITHPGIGSRIFNIMDSLFQLKIYILYTVSTQIAKSQVKQLVYVKMTHIDI